MLVVEYHNLVHRDVVGTHCTIDVSLEEMRARELYCINVMPFTLVCQLM